MAQSVLPSVGKLSEGNLEKADRVLSSGSGAITATVSIVGLVIREFIRKSVAEQARLKAQLEATVALATQQLAEASRVVLDIPDGMVIAVLARPQEAVDVAAQCQAAAADLPLCIGVNYGPVKLIADPAGAMLFGDGILGAITLANLATRGRYLVSGPLFEALKASAPGRASEFSSVGEFTDTSVRSHELYTHDPQAANARKRRLMVVGGLILASGAGLGLGTRALVSGSHRPAVIHFAIAPRGEVFLNGELKGTTPPLKKLEVASGTHVIEVRNSPHPPLRLEVTLGPKQEFSVTHSFVGAKKEEGVFRSLRRQLGL